LPDAVAKLIAEEFGITVRANGSNIIDKEEDAVSYYAQADLCPDCGNSTLVLEEGCAKCYSCGYSRC
jgi:ribonucleoside-diphosphate reductase alpha chain